MRSMALSSPGGTGGQMEAQTQASRPRRDGLAASDSFAFGVPDTGVVVDHEPHLAALYTDRVARMI
jgi:hypothetical protein